MKHLLFALVFLSGTASAFPNWAFQKEAVPPKPGDCADLSGNWKGECTFNGQTKKDEKLIVQFGCVGLSLNGHQVFIGGVKTGIEAGPNTKPRNRQSDRRRSRDPWGSPTLVRLKSDDWIRRIIRRRQTAAGNRSGSTASSLKSQNNGG